MLSRCIKYQSVKYISWINTNIYPKIIKILYKFHKHSKYNKSDLFQSSFQYCAVNGVSTLNSFSLIHDHQRILVEFHPETNEKSTVVKISQHIKTDLMIMEYA